MRNLFIFLSLALNALALDLTQEATHKESKLVVLFSPPKDWQYAMPKQVSAHVEVGFIGDGPSFFHPSINLATEEFGGTLKEYLKAVKAIHTAESKTTWRDLGKFVMRGGEGRLTEICSPSPFGEVKLLQAILLKEHKAYILTAAVLKKEFTHLQKEILESLQSLSFHPDLFSALSDPERKSHLEQIFARLDSLNPEEKKQEWENLQKQVIQGCPEMGGHWHYLALKEAHDRLFSTPPSQNLETPR